MRLACNMCGRHTLTQAFHRITLVSVTGLPDARGAAMALQHSQAQMPGSQAVLCSPSAPDNLASDIRHVPIAPMNYHEYGWFMMFALWRVIPTEFALVVQEDGWVVNAANWQDGFFDCDYIGAPIHLARVTMPLTAYWSNKFEWSFLADQPGLVITPVQNGGFSLRSQRFMRALIDHPHIRVEVPPPDTVEGAPGEPLHMRWQHNALLEDVQLSGLLRPALEAAGMRYAPIELARIFSIEHAGPSLHHGWDALQLFGHHARVRRLVSLSPLTLRCEIPKSQLNQWYGEPEVLLMFERLGYHIEFAAEPVIPTPGIVSPPRRVYDCMLYNGEADVLAIRLHELDQLVDQFVIVEATRTFSGLQKAVAFDKTDPRIARFLPRIRHIVVDDMPIGQNAWTCETFQRNAVVRGLTDARPDDLILLSDADEIPRASVVRSMREDRQHDAFGLGMALYYFYANYRTTEGPEVHSVWAVAATRSCLDATTPDRLRYAVRNGSQSARLIADAGWHLSYLGLDDDGIRTKIAAFSHQEYNTPEVLNNINLSASIASGRDLFGRAGYTWQVVTADEAPRWLSAQQDLKRLFVNHSAVF